MDQNDTSALESLLATGGCSEACIHEALMKCTSRGLTECVRTLLRHGADCNHIDAFTNTPLILAAEGGHVDIVDLLLENNCDVNRSVLSLIFEDIGAKEVIIIICGLENK